MNGPTVWVLGAGFSQPLGAPVFRDVFRSPHTISASRGNYPLDQLLAVLDLYLQHAPAKLGGQGESRGLFWRDPEDFLDVLEVATGNRATAAAEILKVEGVGPPEGIAEKARRILAIECSHFLRGADPTTERWEPYRTWSESLKVGDTVVTFNYDLIPELLSARDPRSKLTVIVPGDDTNESIHQARIYGAPVLKLHGSVDWVGKDGKISVDERPDVAVACENGTDLVLGIPGPNKAGLHKKYAGFSRLWTVAGDALNTAERIVFVGYRFPPTDAQARKQILHAIRNGGSTLKKIQVVLGPNTNHSDVIRTAKLLDFARPGKVEVLPLFAQDFLAFPGWT